MTWTVPGLFSGICFLLDLVDPRPGPVVQFLQAFYRLIDQSSGQRFVRRNLPTLDQVRHGVFKAQQMGHSHHAPRAGQQSQRHFRLPELDTAVVPSDTPVATQADLEPAAQRSSIDGGNHGNR